MEAVTFRQNVILVLGRTECSYDNREGDGAYLDSGEAFESLSLSFMCNSYSP